VVDVALHVEDRCAAGLGDFVLIGVAEAPIALANRQAVVVAPEDLADLLSGVAVRDLGGLRVDERGVAAELGHAGFKRPARAGACEKEQHRQGLVAQQRVRLAERALALEIPGDLKHGLDFFFAEVEVADEVAAAEIGLHERISLQMIPPRASYAPAAFGFSP